MPTIDSTLHQCTWYCAAPRHAMMICTTPDWQQDDVQHYFERMGIAGVAVYPALEADMEQIHHQVRWNADDDKKDYTVAWRVMVIAEVENGEDPR